MGQKRVLSLLPCSSLVEAHYIYKPDRRNTSVHLVLTKEMEKRKVENVF